jgi:glycosyltransferase involved in cell wall biosynthesis
MIFKGKTVCFFSTVPRDKLQFENYSIQDLSILNELGFNVIIANSFLDIPWNCDLYFSWWASGSILPLIKAKLSRKPIITIAGGNEAMLYRDSVTGIPAGYLNNPIWKKYLTRLTLRLSNRLLVVSNFMLNDVLSLGAKSPIVLHNCVDINVFKKSEMNEDYITSIFKIDKNTVLLKRGEVYINAIAIVVKCFPNQKFVIIGKKGDDYPRILSIVKDLSLQDNIVFIDEIVNSEVLTIVQKSKLYVQISDTETFGLAIAEAMSCEVPVLVSRCGAIPEIVGDHGIYVDHNSIESVALGIINFIKLDSTRKAEIGYNLRNQIIDNFTYKKRKDKLIEIIKSVI